jgi:hypothetical protein
MKKLNRVNNRFPSPSLANSHHYLFFYRQRAGRLPKNAKSLSIDATLALDLKTDEEHPGGGG